MATPKGPSTKRLSKTKSTVQTGQRPLLALATILFVTAIVFSGIIENEFTNFDDNVYVTENVLIRDMSATGLANIFTTFVSGHYHPLTMLTYATDYKLWKIDAAKTHAVNGLLHLGAVIMVFWFFWLLTKRNMTATVVATLLFAVHPMRVESVAWIAERKDVLYVFFYLSSLVAYIKHVQASSSKWMYTISLLLFLLAILAKSSAASLPLILLIIDLYMKRGVTRTVILEKIPFFLLSLGFGIVAIIASASGVPQETPFPERIFLVTYALNFYLVRFILPMYQSAIIPFPNIEDLPLLFYVSPLLLAAIAALIYFWKSFRRELLFGFLFFLAGIILVLIKFPIGPAYLAERYSYVPHIGLCFIAGTIVAGMRDGLWGTRLKVVSIPLVAIMVIALSYVSWQRIHVWKNSETLFTDIIEKYPEVANAHYNRGLDRSIRGNQSAAIADFSRAIALDQAYAEAYLNRGIAQTYSKDHVAALSDFNKAISLDSTLKEGYYNRGIVHDMLGHKQEALRDFAKCLAIDSTAHRVFAARGYVLLTLQEYRPALEDYNNAVSLASDVPEYYLNRGVAHISLADTSSACADWRSARRLGLVQAEEFLQKYCQ